MNVQTSRRNRNENTSNKFEDAIQALADDVFVRRFNALRLRLKSNGDARRPQHPDVINAVSDNLFD